MIIAKLIDGNGSVAGFIDVPDHCRLIRYGGGFYALDPTGLHSSVNGRPFVQTHAYIPRTGIRKTFHELGRLSSNLRRNT